MDQAPLIDAKTMFAPKKGKQATKGQKQIKEENESTVRNYSVTALTSLAIRLICIRGSTTTDIMFIIFAIAMQLVSIGGMLFLSKAKVSPGGNVIDGGIDLSLKGGFGDYLIDLTITTGLCCTLSIFSNWIWLIWLWIPCYIVYKFWMGVVAPWIFAPAPEEPPKEVADKKRRKMERKMARAGYR